MNSKDSLKTQWGIRSINGDDFARQISIALNEAALDGYELDKHIIINSSPHILMEGVILICKKEVKEKPTT